MANQSAGCRPKRANGDTAKNVGGVCPLCRKPASQRYFPFCSAACRNRDLLSWLDGRYVLPGRPEADDAEGG